MNSANSCNVLNPRSPDRLRVVLHESRDMNSRTLLRRPPEQFVVSTLQHLPNPAWNKECHQTINFAREQQRGKRDSQAQRDLGRPRQESTHHHQGQRIVTTTQVFRPAVELENPAPLPCTRPFLTSS